VIGFSRPNEGQPGVSRPEPVFARHYDSEQKVDGGSRWTVGNSRTTCAICSSDLATGIPFHTVLRPPPEEVVVRSYDAEELFERVDFCDRCMATVPRESIFAHWTRAVPEAESIPKKRVNLTSLQAYFESLTGEEAKDEANEAAAADQGDPNTQLRYLLGLFLVRKRVLCFGTRHRDHLVLRCNRSARAYKVSIPEASADELLSHSESFNALFC
jgi:hypothetical protein